MKICLFFLFVLRKKKRKINSIKLLFVFQSRTKNQQFRTSHLLLTLLLYNRKTNYPQPLSLFSNQFSPEQKITLIGIHFASSLQNIFDIKSDTLLNNKHWPHKRFIMYVWPWAMRRRVPYSCSTSYHILFNFSTNKKIRETNPDQKHTEGKNAASDAVGI